MPELARSWIARAAQKVWRGQPCALGLRWDEDRGAYHMTLHLYAADKSADVPVTGDDLQLSIDDFTELKLIPALNSLRIVLRLPPAGLLQ